MVKVRELNIFLRNGTVNTAEGQRPLPSAEGQ